MQETLLKERRRHRRTALCFPVTLEAAGANLRAKRQVVHSHPPSDANQAPAGMAIRFRGCDGQDLDLLQQFLDAIATPRNY